MVNRSVWTYFSKHARVIDSGRRNRTFFSESVAFKSWGRARRSLEDLARLRLVGRLWPSLDERKEPVPPSLKVFLVGLGFTKQVTRPPGPSFSHGRGSKLDIPKPSINSWPIPRRTSCASCRRQELSRKHFSICALVAFSGTGTRTIHESLSLSRFSDQVRVHRPHEDSEVCTLTLPRFFENVHPPFSNIL